MPPHTLKVSSAGKNITLSRNQPRNLIQAKNSPAANNTQSATPAANGNKLEKKLKPENELAEVPSASMVPTSALIAKPSPSKISNNRFCRLQKVTEWRRLRAAVLRGLADFAVFRVTALARVFLGFDSIATIQPQYRSLRQSYDNQIALRATYAD